MEFHHLGIAVKDINKSVTHYKSSLEWKTLSQKYHDPIQKVKVLFMSDKNGILYELIEPADEFSPITKLLERNISLYHFCYIVDDIDLKIKELTENGYVLITGPVEAVAFNGRRIAFLFNYDNLTIELVEK